MHNICSWLVEPNYFSKKSSVLERFGRLRLSPTAPLCRYVDFDLAQETASGLKGLRQWITNEYMHSGIREDGPKIFDTLLGMTRGSRPVF